MCSTSGLGNGLCAKGEYCGNNVQFEYINLATDHIETRKYIDYGILNFDNLGNSLLTVFQIINSDTWYPQME